MYLFHSRDSYLPTAPQQNAFQNLNISPAFPHLAAREYRSLTAPNRITNRSISTDSVYTILIRLPGDSVDGSNSNEVPSIRMIPEVCNFSITTISLTCLENIQLDVRNYSVNTVESLAFSYILTVLTVF